MGCATGGWIRAGNKYQSYSQVEVFMLSLLAYIFSTYSPQGIHQGGCNTSDEQYHGGGGLGSYLWIVLGMYRYVFHDGKH